MTSVGFQADADLNQAVVTGVIRRQPEISFQTATEAGLEGLADIKVLALSARQQRVLVTHDRRTMPTEFANFVADSQSAGVLIVSRKTPLEIVIEELILIWAVTAAEEWINRIAKIPL
ncbi:DUF5615 family PIN-like protein [cf. Phormidesmis sp. LEGE 11477]|uniref:DUF5615 family PIN-like protein n=1 Tax=cf. Phormidesmis sp. LEGE 11477 TaxID=1828680 RepID=UPI00187F15CA|nr:DUF5615 family PIN-like protein [cf. Phormidesmis sp. LEGE 11477]